jgi:hypothetical protein
MRGLVTISAVILFVTGCCKPCIQTSTSNQKDSVRTEVKTEVIEKVKDTVIYIPGDSSLIEALLECDSLRNVQLKSIVTIEPGKTIKPTVSLKNNVASFQCKVDSAAIAVLYIERFLSRDSSAYNYHSNNVLTVIEKRVNYVTGWQWFQIWFGRIVLIILLIYGGYKFLSSKFSTPKNLFTWVRSLLSKGKAV